MGVIDQLRSDIRVRHRYADGRAYRRPWSSAHRAERPFGVAFRSPGLLLTPCSAGGPGMGAARPTGPVDWPEFWRQVQTELRAARFCPGSLRVYRQVLRAFRAFAASHQAEFTAGTQWAQRSEAVCSGLRDLSVSAVGHPSRTNRRPELGAVAAPAATSAELAESFLRELTERDVSASWLSVSISRTNTDGPAVLESELAAKKTARGTGEAGDRTKGGCQPLVLVPLASASPYTFPFPYTYTYTYTMAVNVYEYVNVNVNAPRFLSAPRDERVPPRPHPRPAPVRRLVSASESVSESQSNPIATAIPIPIPASTTTVQVVPGSCADGGADRQASRCAQA